MQKDEIGRGEGRWETGAQRPLERLRAGEPAPGARGYSEEGNRRDAYPPRRGPRGGRPRHYGRQNRRKKHAILPNEPILFSGIFLRITPIERNLRSLQCRLQMGSFSKTNPFGGGF